MKKLYILDLDGTLVDSYDAIGRSLNYALRQLGYPEVGCQRVKRAVGRGDRLFIENFFCKKDADIALDIYRRCQVKYFKKYLRLRPFAVNLMRYLRKNGNITAIASNRPRKYTDLIIRQLGIKKYLDYVLCADEIDSLKPNPKILNLIAGKFGVKKSEALFIGDMDIDMETARRAKVDAIFVKGGSSRLKDVKKYKKIKVVSSLKQIIGDV